MVLNNIKLLSDLAVQIIGNVGDLVVTVLYISKGIINEIHNFWLARKEILYVTLNDTIWNLNEMLNFTKNMFPVIDQEMVQMFKDVMGNSEIELNSEYSIYYNKIQGILPILQSEYQSFQQKLPYVNISDSEIQKIIKTLESLVSENYDPLYSQMNNSLNQWGDQISHWAPNIIQNISNMIPLNDIFTFKEAYTKLNRLFIDYLQKEAQQTDLVNLTANELRTEYNSNQNILKITYDSQRPLIIQAVNNLKSLFLQRPSPTNTAFSESYSQSLHDSSIFFNHTLYSALFDYPQPKNLQLRLQEIIKNRLNVTFASIKRQMQAKYDEFLRNFLTFYNELESSLFDLLDKVFANDDSNIKLFLKQLSDLITKLKEFFAIVKSMITRLLDENFHPTKDEIIEMKKINLFKVADYLQETFNEFEKVKTAFQDELKAIPHKLYLLSQMKNGSRLLESSTKKTKKQTKGSRLLEPTSSKMRRLQQSDDQKNIYDKILENVNTFLAPVIIKGDYILALFDLSTKYLNIIDLSFVNKLFVKSSKKSKASL